MNSELEVFQSIVLTSCVANGYAAALLWVIVLRRFVLSYSYTVLLEVCPCVCFPPLYVSPCLQPLTSCTPLGD